MSREQTVTINGAINGTTGPIESDPNTPLLTVIRNDLGLLGPKRGCAQEQCWACAVLVDGVAQPSCQLPVERVDGLPVETVEGLTPIHEFFLAEQAGQCGFCLAGMITSIQGLLNRVRRPSDGEIREALDTNLCRCGSYDRIRRAIRFRVGEPEDPIWEVRTQEPLGPVSLVTSQSLVAHPSVDQWIQIDPADTITVFTGKVEIGQGISTAVAQVAAEGLAVDPDRIRVVNADTALTPDEGITSGSMSVQHTVVAVMLAASTARAALLARASDELGVPAIELEVADGTISHEPTGRSTTYWALRGGRPFKIDVEPEQELSHFPTAPSAPDPTGVTRVDLPAKVSGEASYVHDLRLPDMAYGRIVRPPDPGARLDALDPGPIEALPGVLAVVRNGSFLGVVAESEAEVDGAVEALAAAAQWSPGPPLPDPYEDLLDGTSSHYAVVDGVPVDEAPPAEPPAGELTATYRKPFTMHGSLGPSAAAARIDGDQLTVWTHSQGVFPLRQALADVLNQSEEQIHVIHREGSGCYGHNGADDVALDAALLAGGVPGRPVLVAWSRADEHLWEPYGSAMIVSLGASLDGDRIAALDFQNWSYTHLARPNGRTDGASDLLAAWHLESPNPRPARQPAPVRHIGAHRNSDPLYAIERRRISTHLRTTGPDEPVVRTSALRALGAFANVFAIESFVDELAHHAGLDPVALRLANMDDVRARAVIETAAEAAGWAGGRSSGPGRGQGIGFGQYKNAQTYLAVVVDVVVEESTGVITIEKATVAADSGRIINPDGVSNQLEGGCVQAASWTLKEEVRIEDGRLASHDWDTYPVLRFSESFPVRTILLDRPDQPPIGCGEAAQGPTAAAIANAVFAATGARCRELPLTPDRVLAALAGN